MKQALITPGTVVYYVSGWQAGQPVVQPLANAYRLAEVVDQPFEVAEPFFWTPCPDDAVADVWYYNTASQVCEPIPNVPQPEVAAPKSDGVQTL